jgi:hypothetical protein
MKPSRSNEPGRWISRSALISEGRLAQALSAEERRWLLRELAAAEPATPVRRRRRRAYVGLALRGDIDRHGGVRNRGG